MQTANLSEHANGIYDGLNSESVLKADETSRDGSYKRVILEQHFDKRASFEKQDFNSLELNDSAIPRDHLNPNWWLSHDTAASLANFSWDEADIADWLDSLSFTFSGSH